MGGAIARVDAGRRPRSRTATPRWLINIPASWRDAADDDARDRLGARRPTPRSSRT